MLIRAQKLSGTTTNISTDAATRRKKSLRQSIKGCYVEFCANTSIHGFQYFAQRRPWKEIFFWICIFAILIYFCSSIIVKIYVKWDETPVIVSFSERSTPLWSIPFPAVTICPGTKRAKNATDPAFHELFYKLETYAIEEPSNVTLAQLNETLALMQICDSVEDTIFLPSQGFPPIDYIEYLNRMLPDYQKYFGECRWLETDTECDSLFSKVYTDEGLCFTFNSFRGSDLYRENTYQHQVSLERSAEQPVTDDPSWRYHTWRADPKLAWSLEQGYDQHSGLQTYPARVLSSGSTGGLSTLLQTFREEMDYSCCYTSEDYKILLHSPDDVPSVSKHYVRLSPGKDILIAVKPKMITTSAYIAAYEPRKRQCYFNKDRQLKFFKVYSQNNCERECLTNFTLAQCGCVKFSMPRTLDMPVCGEDKITCYRRARKQLLLQHFSERLRKAELTPGDNSACDCMPACTSLEYEAEISEGSFQMEKVFDMQNETAVQMSIFTVYFKENQFITTRRSELYGQTELLANFGGVCGLFMGISILSIVEMLYHFTLRLWSNMTRITEV